jgi:hypothetical protein
VYVEILQQADPPFKEYTRTREGSLIILIVVMYTVCIYGRACSNKIIYSGGFVKFCDGKDQFAGPSIRASRGVDIDHLGAEIMGSNPA